MVSALAAARVEGVGVSVVAGVVALDSAAVAAHVGAAQADLRQPLRAPARLPLSKHVKAVALAVVDVVESVGRHAAAGRQPPVVQAVLLQLGADAQRVARRQRYVGFDREAGGLAFGVHRHAGHIAFGAVPELFVRAKVHGVAGFLVVCPRLQLPPVELALVAQVEVVAVVARHVHALVGVVLVGNVLHTQFQLQQMGIAAQRKTQRVVAGVVAG